MERSFLQAIHVVNEMVAVATAAIKDTPRPTVIAPSAGARSSITYPAAS